MQSRKFGIELEFSSDFEKVKKVVKSAFRGSMSMLNSECSHRDSTGKQWDLKTDLSTGCELASPKLTLQSPEFKRLKKIVRLLNKHHIRVTDSDGFHVHVHVPDLPLERLLVPWVSLESSIKMLYPSSRLSGGGYSKPLVVQLEERPERAQRVSDILADALDQSGDHHSMMSLTYWNDRSTFEFRAHEGTKDIEEIEMNIMFVLTLVEFFKKDDVMDALMRPVDEKPRGVNADGGYLDSEKRDLRFLKKNVLGSNKNMIRWVNKRLRKFHKEEIDG